MNMARFYPRKTRFTPDSAMHASRDLRRHSAAAPPTELRRSHRKRDQNQRNSGALVLRHRKRPKLPKADAPTPARHSPTYFDCPDTPPRRPRQNCGAPIENTPEIIEIAALYVPDSFRQLPTICGPIFARFCLFPLIISTLSPPVAHHLLRIAPRCAFYFVYLFLIVCLHDHHIFSYLNFFFTILFYSTK